MRPKTFLHICAFSFFLLFSYSEAMATSITIDPLRTFLFTNNDPWSGNGSVPPSLPIELSALGLNAGDVIRNFGSDLG